MRIILSVMPVYVPLAPITLTITVSCFTISLRRRSGFAAATHVDMSVSPSSVCGTLVCGLSDLTSLRWCTGVCKVSFLAAAGAGARRFLSSCHGRWCCGKSMLYHFDGHNRVRTSLPIENLFLSSICHCRTSFRTKALLLSTLSAFS